MFSGRMEEYERAYQQYQILSKREEPYVVPKPKEVIILLMLERTNKLYRDCERYFKGKEFAWHCQVDPKAVRAAIEKRRLPYFAKMRKKIRADISSSVIASKRAAEKKNAKLDADLAAKKKDEDKNGNVENCGANPISNDIGGLRRE